MDLRFPVVVTLVGVAAVAAGVRALHHDPAPSPSPDGGALSFASAPPRVARLRSAAQRVTVYVAGEVVHAGVYALPATDRAVDALKAAGGPTSGADLVAINLAEPLMDGEELVVHLKGEVPPPDAAPASAHKRSHAGHKKKHRRKRRAHAKRHDASASVTSDATDAPDSVADLPTAVVDLNTADENELETLPGIGPSLAERIVAFRELNGPYASADDLLDVGGMTQGRLDAISDYVTASPP